MLGPFLLFALVTYASGHLCGSNEHYVQDCFTVEPTCRIWNPSTKLTASIAGCFCVDGTVRDETTGHCIVKRRCGRCRRREYRNRRGNCQIRRRKCRRRSRIPSVPCIRPKCGVGHKPDHSGKCKVICPPGTTKDKYGKCVTITTEKPCTEREVPNKCYPVVKPTCTVPQVTTNRGAIECQSGCACRAGYVRNAMGKCVPINSCHV